MIVCDTGPRHAAADSSDTHHHTCSELLSGLPRLLVVPISVVIETSFLIEHRLGPTAEARLLTELAGDDFGLRQLSPLSLGSAHLPRRRPRSPRPGSTNSESAMGSSTASIATSWPNPAREPPISSVSTQTPVSESRRTRWASA